jgi:hypothetical protein
MTGAWIAIRDHGLDARSLAPPVPEGPGDEEALAILGHRIGEDEAGENASASRIVEAGMAGDDGVRRRNGEHGDAFEHGVAAEQANGKPRGGVAREIMVLCDERASHAVFDDIDRVGLRIDDSEVARLKRATLPPALASGGVHSEVRSSSLGCRAWLARISCAKASAPS